MAEAFLALITPIGGTGPVDPGWSAGSPRPPYPSQGPGFPTPPIAGPGRPPWWGMAQDPGYGIDQGLGTWGGGNVPYPTPPIYFPPDHPPPLGTWGGGNVPYPTPPIVIPPGLPPTLPEPDGRPIEWKTAWTPTTGWVVIGVPSGPAPTPS